MPFFHFHPLNLTHECCFLDPPGKPGTPQLSEIKDKSITVTWTAPESDGGSPITDYVLEYRPEGTASWKRATTEKLLQLKYTCKGLNETELFEFRVAAENKAGLGPYSDNSMQAKASEVQGKSFLM